MEKTKDFQDFVSQLKLNNDLVDVASKYITLEQKGKNFWAPCPFHSEKDPSFSINSSEQYYHCFGCGESGDVIKFIQKMESQDFIGAVEIIAKNSGMEMPNFSSTDNSKERRELKDKIFNANRDAARFYHSQLLSDKGKNAIKYLSQRGVDNKTIKIFGIGVSPGWNELPNHLMKTKGHSYEVLKSAGLISQNSTGGYYDVMAYRLMFPIIDSYEKVVAFSGRTLTGDDKKIAKYRNTEQTIIFDKSSVIYGINNIKKLKQSNELKEVVIVEGQMDVIALNSAGIRNAVACLGTALTPKHAKLLKRFTTVIKLSMDGDSAGNKAAFKSIDVLEKEGLDTKVITLPDGTDPDDYIKNKGKDKYLEKIKNSIPAMDFKLEILKKTNGLETDSQKLEFMKNALIECNKLDSDAKKEMFINKISTISGINTVTLEKELENIIQNRRVFTKIDVEEKEEINMPKYEEYVLACILQKKEYADIHTINPDWFSFIELKTIFTTLSKIKKFKTGDLYTIFQGEQEKRKEHILNRLVGYRFNGILDDTKNDYLLALRKLEVEYYKKSRNRKANELAAKKGDKSKLLKEISDITKKIKNLGGK